MYYLVDFSADAKAFSAMNIDIGFSQVEYGLLASLAFTALFAVASLGAGVAADRFNRKQLTIGSALLWSAATLGTSFANSFELVLACRVLMGLACAFSTPTAYTLLRDRVTRDRQATASSIYGTGVALASGLSSLTLLLDESVGWRSSLDIVGGFGIIATALTIFLLDDDTERNQDTQSSPKVENAIRTTDSDDKFSQIGADIASVLDSERARWIFLGSFLRFSSGLCIGVWAAPFFRMEFSEFQTDYAVAQAFISGGIASFSGILGGTIADWLSSRASDQGIQDNGGSRLWVPVVGSLLAAPAWFLAVQPDIPFESAMIWLAIEYLVSSRTVRFDHHRCFFHIQRICLIQVAECWFGPTISTLQAAVGPKVGGTAQGLFTLTGAVGNLAPSILGYLYGQSGGASSNELSALLSSGVCFGYLSSALCFSFAAKSITPQTSATTAARQP